jgi:hypothetical protein
VSPPSPFEIPADGFADNVTIFANVTFPVAGDYYVQTLINSNLFMEQKLSVTDLSQQRASVSTDTIQ